MIIEEMHPERKNVAVSASGSVTVTIPFTLKKWGGKKYIITPDNAPVQFEKPQQYAPLVSALLKAFEWKWLLDNGDYATLTELAQKKKLNERYAMRLFRVTFLAPDIVKAILDGRQPRYLTVLDLLHSAEHEWSAQREKLGFPSIN